MRRRRDESDKAAKYLELFLAGMTYREIGERFGIARVSVAARICEYRKDNGIAPTYRKMSPKQIAATKQKRSGRKSFSDFDATLRQIREQDHLEAKRREDGVLVCPVRYAAGYGRSIAL